MGGYHDSQVVELTGNILIVSIVALSVIVIFVFLVHLYAKCFWYRRDQHLNSRRPHRHRRGDFTPAGHIEHQPGVTVLRRGLNPTFLKTIPVIHFDPKHFAEGLECTVCLSELVQGAKARILPKCNHGFHVECIDMWFYSHSTCPICRDPVSDESQISVENLLESRQPQEPSSLTDGVVDYFPTNILFWGDETEVSTLTSQLEEASNNSHHHHQPSSMLTDETPPPSSSQINNNRARTDLVIHIPRHIDDHDDDVDDQKSPVSSRIGSLRRILSGSRRFINPF